MARDVSCGEHCCSQAGYDRKLVFKVDSLNILIRETQPQEWAKIERQYGVALPRPLPQAPVR